MIMKKKIFTLGILFGFFAMTFGQSYIINKVGNDDEIVLDGVADEIVWADPAVVEETFGSVHLGADGANPIAPGDAFDYEVKFKALYGDEGLYLLFNVSDLDLDTISEKDDGEGWPRVDIIEIYMMFGDGSTMPDDKTNIWDGCNYGVFQVPIDLNANVMTGGASSTGCYDDFKEGVVTATTFSDDGYVIEEFIPWSVLSDHNDDPVTPAADLEFVLDFGGMDVDNEWTADGNPYSHVYWKSSGHLWNWPWTDYDAGKAVLSANVVTEVESLKMVNGTRVYPNPVANELRVDGDVDAVSIYSVVGKEVFSSKLHSDKVVNVSDFNQGIYFVRLYKGTQLLSTRKIVKVN